MKFRYWLFIFILVSLPASISHAGMSRTEALEKFVAAESAYKAGDYPRAVEVYESILAAGTESGAIYYNLGNAYYKSGEAGRALLNYERALRLIPRDSDLNFNYHYLRSKLNLEDESRNLNWAQKLVYYHIHFYTLEEMALIVFILGCLSGGVYLLCLYLKWPTPLKRISLSLAFFLIVVFTFGIIFKINAVKNMAVVLNAEEAKFEPNPNSTTHYKLPAGEKVKILSEEEQWIKIKRADDKAGWVKRESVGRIVQQ